MIKLKLNLFEGDGKEPRQKHNKETNFLEKEQKEHLIELNFTYNVRPQRLYEVHHD